MDRAICVCKVRSGEPNFPHRITKYSTFGAVFHVLVIAFGPSRFRDPGVTITRVRFAYPSFTEAAFGDPITSSAIALAAFNK